jgi:hypothetical protein
MAKQAKKYCAPINTGHAVSSYCRGFKCRWCVHFWMASKRGMESDRTVCTACTHESRFTTWYPSLKRHVIKSRAVPLPDTFLDYLESDGMQLPLPPENAALCARDPRVPRACALVTSAEGPSDSGGSITSSTSPTPVTYCFPELELALQALVDEFGGVFIKLEWTAPVDATWIMDTGSAKCSTTGHIFLLLKASDLVQHDVEAFKILKSLAPPGGISPLHVVVRPWYSMNRANEFRCFVRQGQLIGISQRHTSEHFKHLEAEKLRITESLLSFFESIIKPAVKLRSCEYFLQAQFPRLT